MKNKNVIKEFLIMTLGMILIAFSAEYFLIPNSIAAGGLTGFCVVFNHYIPVLSIEAYTFVFNIVLFIVGFIFIGRNFGAKTIYAALGLTGIMWCMKNFLHPVAITHDLMLNSIIAPVLTGTGLALVFSQGASSGGTDIIAKILNKYVKLDIGKCMLCIDGMVVIAGGLTFGWDKGMYAIITVFLNGTIIDKVIEGFKSCKQVFIMSKNEEEIKNYIINDLKRGCTIFTGKGAYTGSESSIIYSVLSRKQFIKLKAFIKAKDEGAFITVNEAHEVLGEGFADID